MAQTHRSGFLFVKENNHAVSTHKKTRPGRNHKVLYVHFNATITRALRTREELVYSIVQCPGRSRGLLRLWQILLTWNLLCTGNFFLWTINYQYWYFWLSFVKKERKTLMPFISVLFQDDFPPLSQMPALATLSKVGQLIFNLNITCFLWDHAANHKVTAPCLSCRSMSTW
jgi:hypothetical protein